MLFDDGRVIQIFRSESSIMSFLLGYCNNILTEHHNHFPIIHGLLICSTLVAYMAKNMDGYQTTSLGAV